MTPITIGKATLYNCDCMELLKATPDKFYDLAIVDPPYFKGVGKFGFYSEKISNTGIKRGEYKDIKYWDENIPNEKYFNELYRVSKNQIIWGANYYENYIHFCGRDIWDKKNDSSSFSKAEIAANSKINSVQMFRYEWNGMLQGDMKNKEVRIHPTQKPIKLYEWLLTNYAKEGDKILDTHLGSGSHAIACNNLGFELTACELDRDYFEAACKRIEQASKQTSLFEPQQHVKPAQEALL